VFDARAARAGGRRMTEPGLDRHEWESEVADGEISLSGEAEE
jgi:hypothetical protein